MHGYIYILYLCVYIYNTYIYIIKDRVIRLQHTTGFVDVVF